MTEQEINDILAEQYRSKSYVKYSGNIIHTYEVNPTIVDLDDDKSFNLWKPSILKVYKSNKIYVDRFVIPLNIKEHELRNITGFMKEALNEYVKNSEYTSVGTTFKRPGQETYIRMLDDSSGWEIRLYTNLCKE